jgi:hypothetical protein
MTRYFLAKRPLNIAINAASEIPNKPKMSIMGLAGIEDQTVQRETLALGKHMSTTIINYSDSIKLACRALPLPSATMWFVIPKPARKDMKLRPMSSKKDVIHHPALLRET